MKMKQTMKRWLVYILAVAMIVALVPTRTEAKTCAQHTVFTKKQINERISTIRDFYYNKPKQLAIKKQNVSLYGDNFTISYYIHDKDLMFGYGVAGKTEYRLYFYKTQLIQLLVDEPGKPRKTYTQLYKKLETTFYDESLALYMDLENYARKKMESYSSPKNKILSREPVVITKVSGNTIVYHKLAGYGSDGCMWSIGATSYKAKVSSHVKIEDYSTNPVTPTYRSMNWLKKNVSSPYLGLAGVFEKSGKTVSNITIAYYP